MTQLQQVGQVATSIFTEDGITKVIYHNTAVVKFDANSVILDSGGWRTSTTKNRMNQASNQFGLGFSVFQKDFEWFVILPTGETVAFEDGWTFKR